ncbi:D-alanyl-D-alanine dipeptidase [Pararhodospirillum photometricum]|uniref:D-alanyl-D-alanine dipeptidase n=1 Tax=Pararhodospirillum photometricum TaxID=1084 RepID=UPI0005A19EFB|nr:D-alanyl-D-alanine dipeptidase [Pararhodospirillum photometricum]
MLTEITEADFNVTLDIVYATSANFTGQPVYARAACYLHPDAAAALRVAVDLAARQGLRLHVFDGFRPSEAQWLLWNHTPDPTFISDPRRGSPHSMGAAVDLTLADAATGARLDMGTGFDDLTPASHHGATTLSAEAQRNRFLLLGIMTAAGWDFYRNEWWHYQLFKARERYPVLSDGAAGTKMMAEPAS